MPDVKCQEKVTDEDLAILGRFSRHGVIPPVDTLELTDCTISDKGLMACAEVLGLKHLFLRRTGVTDQGLVHLMDLVDLEWLDLSETAVTDSGVRQLVNLPNLTALYLERTSVTPQCVIDLQLAAWPSRAITVAD